MDSQEQEEKGIHTIPLNQLSFSGLDWSGFLTPLIPIMQKAAEAAEAFKTAMAGLSDWTLTVTHDPFIWPETKSQRRRRTKREIREEIWRRRMEKPHGRQFQE